MSELTPDKPELEAAPLAFPVVGVGASAGGLEAFETFLRSIDPEAPGAFILIQHLDPTHESLLPELLARHSPLPVEQVEDGANVRDRRVYVIPAASGLAIDDGVLSLVDFDAPRGFRRPINDFFQSLAMDQGSNAAAVVLTGTGGDGSVGLRAIKEAGGVAMVQDPAEARYDGMPSSAIATGVVDFVLPVAEMPATLNRYFSARAGGVAETWRNRDDFLSRVMEAVRHRTGHDFGHYKVNTILRRVQRRMQVLDLSDPDDYVATLVHTPSEAAALFRDLLINVTSFFRDPEVFDLLRRKVIPDLVGEAGPDRPIRVWVPGCSSGEEAYSIAILFAEAIGRADPRPDVQIFATDIDEDMLRRARRGAYAQSDVADLPPELLDRYFRADEGGYVIVDAVREMVRVSPHSLIKDPPFSRIDLVSCRNLLIYFDAELQARVLPLFHYALKPDGWLVLGSAENIGGREDLFGTAFREERIYRKVGRSTAALTLPLSPRPTRSYRRETAARATPDERKERESGVQRRMMERYVPPHVVIDAAGNVLHASARTAPFLRLSIGEPTTRLLDLAPTSLRTAVRSVLNALKERRRRIVRRGIEMRSEDDGLTIRVDLIADPIDAQETVIVFRETARVLSEDDDTDVDDFHSEQRITELEDELSETRSRLRSTVEELETSNEELKSSNEEMMSMNEELQSANEELSTVNEELKSKLEELAQANADLVNFLEATQIATVFVDTQLRIRSFTPAVERLFRVAESDRGRALSDVRTPLDHETLERAMRKVLEGGEHRPERVEGIDGGVFVFRALPYVMGAGQIDGVVLTFDDVSALDAAQREADDRLREIELIYENSPTGIALVDEHQRYRRINPALAEYNGFPVEAHLGKTITEMLPEIGPRLQDAIDEVLRTGETLRNWELEAAAPTDPEDAEVFELDIYALPAPQDARTRSVGIIVRRITEFRRMERELRHVMGELQHRVKNSLATVLAIVRQTVRSAKDQDRIGAVLEARIGALAATHNLLTKVDWRAVQLREILDNELEPYDVDDRLRIRGPKTALAPKPALTLAMVLHELTTNAAKHGAIADPEGRVTIEWREEDGTFSFEWRETLSAGRPHARPGRGTDRGGEQGGFGLRFIERAIRHDLDGTVETAQEAEGFRMRFAVPLDALALPENEPSDAGTVPSDAGNVPSHAGS